MACGDITHGVTWKDYGRGPPGADFCRRCGEFVRREDAAKRQDWTWLNEALRVVQGVIRRGRGGLAQAEAALVEAIAALDTPEPWEDWNTTRPDLPADPCL